MNNRIVYHVTWNSGEFQWEVKRSGEEKTLFYISGDSDQPKERAIAKAISFARNDLAEGRLSQIKVHNKKGRFQFERTYGNDPRESEG